jgi:putative transposase
VICFQEITQHPCKPFHHTRWNHNWVNVSACCAGEYVGLEEIDDGVWNVFFGPLKLGRLDERHMRMEDVNGRLLRHR